jgi:hypothetical protein
MEFSRRRVVLLAAALVGASAVVLGCSSPGTVPAKPGIARSPDIAAAPDIAVAPTQVAHTALGAVGYREVGHGPALLLITGFSAGMDDWAPYFVNALAEHFRVVVFDNAGIGQTALLRIPLSVPAMAAQTSALISTLRLGPPSPGQETRPPCRPRPRPRSTAERA